MSKSLCYCGIDMHPRAMKELETYFEVSCDPNDIDRINSAIVYGIPGQWLDTTPPLLRRIGCHLCRGDARKWAEVHGIEVVESDLIWITTAEHTFALLLSATRNIASADRDIRDDLWLDHSNLKIKNSGVNLYGKTLGIWGLGRIGRHFARMLSGLRMRVVYNDLNRLTALEEQALNTEYMPIDDMLTVSDFLVVLLPLDDKTRGIIDKSIFSKLKPDCILINTARANIIDEDAFRDAVSSGIIAGAGLDVFWREGERQPDWIKNNNRIVITPHLGGSTYECDAELVNALI